MGRSRRFETSTMLILKTAFTSTSLRENRSSVRVTNTTQVAVGRASHVRLTKRS